MREASSGLSFLRALLIVVGFAALLFVGFWVALIAIGVGIIYVLARAILRALTGRGRSDAVHETIIIEPGHRENYDNGNVIVLPVSPASRAS